MKQTHDEPVPLPVQRSDSLTDSAARLTDRTVALAHDLRSPLCAVIGFTRLAREELARGNTAQAQELLARAERSASTIDRILHATLAPAASAACDALRVIEEVRLERKPELERRRIRLAVPPDAPLLACTAVDLYRVLSNLIGNAIDHMGAPRPAVIAIEIERSGDVATLRVRDNGGGIAAADRERVFAPGETRNRERSLHGLGLAIVRELAASWGGRVWAESGDGATLCVTIPVAR